MGLRMLNPFYSPITFSITGEDYKVVERALRITPEATVLCIGSAGDTPLNLLQLNPQRVDAVDMSFPQICMAVLKAEAMRWLDLSEYRVLLGVVQQPELAVAHYQLVRPHLPAEIRDFWDTHLYMIGRGLLWQGGIQRMLAMLGKLLFALLGREGTDALRRLSTREQAEDFYQRYVCNWRFQAFSRLTINRLTYHLFYPSLGFRYLPPGMSPHEFSMLKIRQIILDHPIVDNPYLFPMLFGCYPSSPDGVPPYLATTGYDAIKTRIGRLNFVHSDIHKHLSTATENSIDRFALCNVMDWMNADEFAGLLSQLIRVARNEARVLIFSRSTTLAIPLSLRSHLNLDTELSRSLVSIDRLGYYKSANVIDVSK